MPSHRGNANWKGLLEEIEKLLTEWEGKNAPLLQVGRAWLRGVVAGIEACLKRFAEGPMTLTKLKALLGELERKSKTKPATKSAEAQQVIEGIDYGARLVIELVCQYFNLQRRKPAASANNGKAPGNHKARRGSRP